MKGVFPDDPEMENIDPMLGAYMFNHWVEDQVNENSVLDNQAYLIGSFINPELVKKMLGVGAETFESTDDEFEQLSKELLKNNQENNNKNLKRRKRKLKFKE